MTDARDRLFDSRNTVFRHWAGAAHHDDGQRKRARRGDLAIRGIAAAVLGNDDFHAVFREKRPFRRFPKGTAFENEARIGRGLRSIDRIDAANNVAVPGQGGERGKFLPADGEEDRAWGLAQKARGVSGVHRLDPAVALDSLPGRALQLNERHRRLSRRMLGIFRNAGSEGMGGVDQNPDALVTNAARQPLGPAEAADAHFPRLRARLRRAPGKRQGDFERGFAGQRFGKPPRLARAAEYENAPRGHHAI